MKKHSIYYEENKDKLDIYHKAYMVKNREDVLSKRSEARRRDKDKIKAGNNRYYIENREKLVLKVAAYARKRKLTDLNFKLRLLVSSSINKNLKSNKGSKNNESCIKYLKFTISELKAHLEKQFEPWMNWGNHGNYRLDKWVEDDVSTWRWHIDHIVPHSHFKYTTMQDEAFDKCWTLSNLRPLSAKQNIKDGNRR